MSEPGSRGQLELGEVLLQSSRLEPEQLAHARIRQQATQVRLSEVLVEEGILTGDEVLAGIGEQLGLEFRQNVDAADIDEELVKRVPIAFAKQHTVLPLSRDQERSLLRVVTCDAFNTEPLDDLRILFGTDDVEIVLSSQRSVISAINEVYDRGTAETGLLAEEATDDLDALADEASHEPQDLLEATDDAPIIRLVNSLLQHAVKERASDIHIEPFEKEIRVRFRIDDVLYEPMKPLPRTLQASIASRIKIMGNLDIAEKRLPQDGRIRLKIAGRDYDVRLSTVPVAFGERLVMRLLPDSQALLDLEKIGFNKE
jgi:general secretion pathway protein E